MFNLSGGHNWCLGQKNEKLTNWIEHVFEELNIRLYSHRRDDSKTVA